MKNTKIIVLVMTTLFTPIVASTAAYADSPNQCVEVKACWPK